MELEYLRTQVRDGTYTQMPDVFVAAFPAMRPAYEELLAEWDDEFPGEYNIFEYVVGPCLINLLRDASNHAETLTVFFAMLEEMALHAEEDVRELLNLTIAELIDGAGQVAYEQSLTFMGPAMRVAVLTLGPRFGVRPVPYEMRMGIPDATIPRGAAIPDWENDPD